MKVRPRDRSLCLTMESNCALGSGDGGHLPIEIKDRFPGLNVLVSNGEFMLQQVARESTNIVAVCMSSEIASICDQNSGMRSLVTHAGDKVIRQRMLER